MLSRPAVAVARAALRCPASIRGAQFATAAALCGRPNRPAQQAPAASAWVQPLSSGRAFAAPVASLPAWAAGRSFSAAAANQLADIVTPNKAFVTKPAPYFGGKAVLPNGTFGQISLDDYKGKWVVLFSYPLDFTFVCPTEIIDYSNHAEEFKKINCEVVAFSVDSIFTHLAWVNTPRKAGGVGSLNIPLLSDDTHQISRDYGVLQAQGANLRGLWIIDPNGVVRHITINDPPVGRNPKETLRLVQAFQFVEKHGEVCPSGWTPGAETMKADPQGSKAYFEKVNQQ